MAFYVAVVLTAALAAAGEGHRARTLQLIWGTTIGLALAHLFAFRLAARLVTVGAVGRHESRLVVAQLAGAALVAGIATVPALIFSEPADVEAARYVIAGFIGFFAYKVGRSNGGTVLRSGVFAGFVLALASVVAVIKNLLLGH